jgi:hypothetical protein
MFQALKRIWETNKLLVIGIIIAIVVVLVCGLTKSNFNDALISSNLTKLQPRSLPPVTSDVPGWINLAPPVVPEEIGLAQFAVEGTGAGMSNLDSDAFNPRVPGYPGPLLTEHSIPEAYGESDLADPTGMLGAVQGARVLRLKSAGNQSNFKPMDDAENHTFSRAYLPGEVHSRELAFINGNKPIDYSDEFNPENKLIIQTSPGQGGTLAPCEQTYPNVVKYGDFCITAGDIPYGQVVDGKVNPRLVSRWESFTGDYSPKEALTPIDGVLYPNLAILTN